MSSQTVTPSTARDPESRSFDDDLRSPLQGILPVYKPPRVTSRAVVDLVSRQLRLQGHLGVRVGHAGTLDPLAEGVLVLAIGSASRLIPYLHLYPKTYQAKFELGRWSDSADLETDVIVLSAPPQPDHAAVVAATRSLTGPIRQVPPMHSAVKIGGKRAYEAARKNQLLDLTAREVTIHRFEIADYHYPTIAAEIECGTGTYIRSLGVDLGKVLGTRALMSQLTRTAVGPFRISEAVRIDAGLPENFLESLQPPASAVGMLPRLMLADDLITEVDNGRDIYHGLGWNEMLGQCLSDKTVASTTADNRSSGEFAVLDHDGRLRAIVIARHGGWGPKRVFRPKD